MKFTGSSLTMRIFHILAKEKTILQKSFSQREWVFAYLSKFSRGAGGGRILTLGIDDTAKGGLTRFWKLFTVIPSAPKDLSRQ